MDCFRRYGSADLRTLQCQIRFNFWHSVCHENHTPDICLNLTVKAARSRNPGDGQLPRLPDTEQLNIYGTV